MKYVLGILSLAVLSAVIGLHAVEAEPSKTAAATPGGRIFKGMDKNADGAITRSEAGGVVGKYFNRIDADSNGRVTPKELSEAIARTKRRRKAPPETESSPRSGFKRPKPAHRTSRHVPTPWLGYKNDDSPEVRNATYLKSPKDIRAMAHPVLRHRLITIFTAEAEGTTTDKIIDQILETVPQAKSENLSDGKLPQVLES